MSASRFPTECLGTAKPKPNVIDPADANYSGEWNEMISKLGFAVIVIQMERCDEIFKDTEFFKPLGEEMTRAELGHYDSSQWHPQIRHFFYVDVKRLGEAFEFLKAGLKQRGLLEYASIRHFDAADKCWRALHSAIEK